MVIQEDIGIPWAHEIRMASGRLDAAVKELEEGGYMTERLARAVDLVYSGWPFPGRDMPEREIPNKALLFIGKRGVFI